MTELKSVCQNPWCKATFVYKESEMTSSRPVTEDKYKHRFKKKSEIEEIKKSMIPPKQCYKCRSFNDELSGGIEWTDFKYDGPRFDGTPHEMNYKITTFK